jgi:hypothetical protein
MPKVPPEKMNQSNRQKDPNMLPRCFHVSQCHNKGPSALPFGEFANRDTKHSRIQVPERNNTTKSKAGK